MIVALIFILGAAFGSFADVLIDRIPKNESIIFPSSRCEVCKKPIKFIYNIPILGYFFTRGKCFYCNAKVSMLYPVIEALCGAMFLAIYFKFGVGFEAFFTALCFTLLLCLSIIDYKTMQAPDSINFLALAFAIISSAFFSLSHLIDSAKSALILAGTFSLLRLFIGYLKGEEALGEADIIVVATLGAALGYQSAFSAIFYGCITALPIALYLKRKGQNRLPFIPFLVIGGFLEAFII